MDHAVPRSALSCTAASRVSSLGGMLLALFLFLLPLAGFAAKPGGAGAVFPPAPVALPPAVPPQFDITGFLQAATLDTAGTICHPADPRLAGGTLTVNDIRVVVPCNTILQMPATSLTWAELFSLAPADTVQAGQTGLALVDKVAANSLYNGPLPSYEVRVQGNVVDGKYIAGLVFVAQQSVNVGQGIINYIDYASGELHVGGQSGIKGAGDVRVRLNDPVGRFGKRHGGPGSGAEVIEAGYDPRFTADVDNPTVRAVTGFPMCIPRFDPFDPINGGDDPKCPQVNRPRAPACHSLPAPFPPFVLPPDGQFCRTYVMDPPSTVSLNPACTGNCPTDPTRQAPFEVGDTIDYIGNLRVDAAGPYISAHTVTGRVGIYTTPGTMPAYVAIDVMLQGTSALPIANLPQEATSRAKVEGFASDPTSLVDIYAIDVDPISGATRDRLLGTEPASGPPVIGRFRFRPAAGAFLPPTREMRVVSRTLCGDNFLPCSAAGKTQLYANGLLAGQYHAPNFEFIFPENLIVGDPVVPANFQDLPFLFCGSGPLTTASAGSNPPLVGQLTPPPWAPPMYTPSFAGLLCPSAQVIGGTLAPPVTAPAVGAPVITTAPAVTVSSVANVTLSASASDPNTPPLAVAFSWQQTGGPAVIAIPGGTPVGSSVSFTAPAGPATLNFVLTVTNTAGLSASAPVTVTVTPQAADTITIGNVTWDNRQNKGKLTVVANSSLPATTAGLQLFVQATASSFFIDPVTNLGQPLTVQLAAAPLPMSLVSNQPGAPAVCPTPATTCWQFFASGVIVDPVNPGSFLSPDQVTVTSSSGGAATSTGISIRLR